MAVEPIMPSSHYRHFGEFSVAFTPPRFALFAVPMLVLMGCALEYDLRADGGQTAEQPAQCERMDRLLDDRTLSSQQLEAVRATMNTTAISLREPSHAARAPIQSKPCARDMRGNECKATARIIMDSTA